MAPKIMNDSGLVFKSVEEVLNHEFVGNYAGDGDAFDAIREFTESTDLSLEDQLRIENHIGVNGMGVPEITMAQLIKMKTEE